MFEFNGTLSETWVLAEDRGAVAFIGATWLTTLSNLSAFAKHFYTNLATDNYGERLGDILRATIVDFDLNSSFHAEQLKQVTLLHGDPAIKLNSHEGPDYLVNGPSVGINPTLLNTQMDSFDLEVSITNIGSATPDSFLLRFEHQLPDGTLLPSLGRRVASPKYETEHLFTLPLPDENALGFNKLHITVDALDSIPEMPTPAAESNNTYQHTIYVVANDAFPIYPYEYSIVTEPNPTLKASTANAFAEMQKYHLQIDTTAYFNSPVRQETTIEKSGGIIGWTPTFNYQDNTVYYWRISIDSTLTTGQGFNWHESSFVYMGGSSPGWNQSHFHQLIKENEYNDLELEEPDRKLKYAKTVTELRMKDGVYAMNNYKLEMSPLLNSILVQEYFACMPIGFHVVVIDPLSVEPWVNPPPGIHGSYNCKEFDFHSFPFKSNSVEEREKLIHFLEDVVPSGSYVVVYSIQAVWNYDYHPEEWALDSVSNSYQKNIFQVLEEQGATRVRELETKGAVPYYFIYQKDNPSFLDEHELPTEVVADSLSQFLTAVYTLKSPTDNGSVESVTIGPAKSWQSLLWNLEGYDPSSDKVQLKVYGITNNEQRALLHNNISVFDTTLTHISAQQYPFLQLEMTVTDSLLRTSPHLDYWRVLYEPAPDAALRADTHFSFQSDTLQQGEPLILDIAVENVTPVDMDSLLVHYTVFDQNNEAYLNGTRMAPLLQEDTLIAHFEFDTEPIATALNQLLIEVNPNDDQPEQHHFNNVGLLPFYLTRDIRNPLLDVTFDGVHIMDGDIVSAKPVISVSLLDENEHLALNDTSLFRIKLKHPDGNTIESVYLSDPDVNFYPAEEGDLDKENRARIEIRRFFETDGIYELLVDAQDRSGNDAGSYDYQVRFEVINEAMISNVFNYPNPFSTQTQFVFTLTGADVPDFMKIQIMTASGKVVREITQDELGPIHVGKNITEYRWDGTDQYGDRLANGVYLYRVVTRKADGELYGDYNTNTNQYFKKGIGKMVLIR